MGPRRPGRLGPPPHAVVQTALIGPSVGATRAHIPFARVALFISRHSTSRGNLAPSVVRVSRAFPSSARARLASLIGPAALWLRVSYSVLQSGRCSSGVTGYGTVTVSVVPGSVTVVPGSVVVETIVSVCVSACTTVTGCVTV